MLSKDALAMMDKYECHKEVHALKISKIERKPADLCCADQVRDPGFIGNFLYLLSFGSAMIEFEKEGASPTADKLEIHVTYEFMKKHEPKVGGYLVVYSDGYMSWSPADAFEGGYTQVSQEKT